MNKGKTMLVVPILAGLLIGLTFSSALGQISNVQVSNVTSSSATITWTTSDTTDGCVIYGLTTALGDTACDPRPNDDVHYVVILGLSVETTYYFEVISGELTDDNGGAFYAFTTTDVASGIPFVIFGNVRLRDGISPAIGTIVNLQVESSGDSSYPLSDLTNSSGVWSLNLGNLKNLADGTVLLYSTGDSTCIVARAAENVVGQHATTVSGSSPQNTGSIITYVPGDVNGNGVVNPEDVIVLLNYLFRGGSFPDPLVAGDCNGNGLVKPPDVIYLLNYLFRGGPPPEFGEPCG